MICWGRNQKGEICYINWLFYVWTKSKETYVFFFLFNFGCLKCWVMFGDIEYNIYFLMMPRGRKIWHFWIYWWIIISCNKMRIYIDCFIIFKWQIDLCIKIGRDLKISNIKICIILGGVFMKSFKIINCIKISYHMCHYQKRRDC